MDTPLLIYDLRFVDLRFSALHITLTVCKSNGLVWNGQAFCLKKLRKRKKMQENLHKSRKSSTFAALLKKHRGVEQLVARQAHNLEVARSNPASATQEARISGFFSLWQHSYVLPVDVLRRAKRPFGPSANPASATQEARILGLLFVTAAFSRALYKKVALPAMRSATIVIWIRSPCGRGRH